MSLVQHVLCYYIGTVILPALFVAACNFGLLLAHMLPLRLILIHGDNSVQVIDCLPATDPCHLLTF